MSQVRPSTARPRSGAEDMYWIAVVNAVGALWLGFRTLKVAAWFSAPLAGQLATRANSAQSWDLMKNQIAARPAIETVPLGKAAEQLLDELSPRHPRWQPEPALWMFSGHADAGCGIAAECASALHRRETQRLRGRRDSSRRWRRARETQRLACPPFQSVPPP